MSLTLEGHMFIHCSVQVHNKFLSFIVNQFKYSSLESNLKLIIALLISIIFLSNKEWSTQTKA